MDNNKIIGFVIYPKTYKFNIKDIDVFDVGLRFLKYEKNGYTLLFWGIGNLKVYDNKNIISLALNQDLSIYDRNVVIDFSGNNIIVENDWLGSIPIFYNKKARVITTLFVKSIDTNNKLIYDLDGLNCYFKAGYSLFGNTMIKDIKFLRWFSKVEILKDKLTIIEKKEDLLSDFSEENTNSKRLILDISKYINNKINGIEQIIIPTSGGYDSRLINSLVETKEKIKTYSYGISKDSSKSYELIYPSILSKRLNTYRKEIKLKKYLNENYCQEWFNLYGCATHLHGMYHIEFYKKINKDIDSNLSKILLSGIVGDLWAGKFNIGKIENIEDIRKLYFSHGINIETKIIKRFYKEKYIRDFWNKYKNEFKDERVSMIFLVRIKLILLSYLITIPEYLGIISETPFLNKDIVLSILNLPEEVRIGRGWQNIYFEEKNIYFEKEGIIIDKSNYLDQINIKNTSNQFKLHNIPNIIRKTYINKIERILENRELENNFFIIISKIFGKKIAIKIKYISSSILKSNIFFNKNLSVLYKFHILKPLEYLENYIKKNNE